MQADWSSDLNLPRFKLKQIVSNCKNFFLAELNEIKDRREAERRAVRGGERDSKTELLIWSWAQLACRDSKD